MDKTAFDQAEGLRRMLAGSRPRVFTFLSSVPGDEKSAMLVNLGASLAGAGNSVLLLDACVGSRGVASCLEISQAVTLLHVARREYELDDAVQHTPQGFGLATLARCSVQASLRNRNHAARLASSFDVLAGQFDVMMLDAELDADGNFSLAAMADGEMVIQVSDSAASIKSAYSIIKRIDSQYGRRPFSVLVTGTSEQRAQVVYANMAKAASRYLAISLNSIGFLPADDHLGRSVRLGRSVVDAHPTVRTSVAFRRLAGYFSCSGVPSAGYGMIS